jgi:CheY-like chemotaxis protein
LTRFSEARPDLVFLDLVMSGGMYGHEVLARLRGMCPDARIVVATTDTQTATAEQVLELGAAAIVHKPITAEKLGAVLKTQ